MAETAKPSTSNPPRPLISLEAEERRKLLQESLRADNSPIREVFPTVSANESRYISQFTSGRWREHIHQSSIQQSCEDSEASSEDALKEDPLVMYGYDLQSDEYRRECKMIMRWNVVEREQHFPNLEKGYLEKRRAKNQVKGQSPQSRDDAMEERQVSPSIERVLETSPKGTKKVGESSEVTLQEPSQDVAMEESPESAKPEAQAFKESPKPVPEACKESSGKSPVAAPSESQSPEIQKTSANLQEGTNDTKKKSSVPEDSKLAKRSSESKMETSGADSKLVKDSESDDSKLAKSSESKRETSGAYSKLAKGSSESDDSKLAKKSSESEMETSGATSRGKRKADSAATSDGKDPDEKRTRKTSEK